MSQPLRIGYFSASAVLAAADDGIFAAHGLTVSAEPVKSSSAQFRSLVDGEYDLVLTSPDNVAAYRFGSNNPLGEQLDVRIIAAVNGGLGLALLAKPGVDTPGQLRGMRLGVDVPESGFAFWLYDFLADHGLRRDADYEVVSLGATPRRAVALADGQCDATLLYGGLTIAARADGCVQLGRLTEHVRPYLGTVLAGATPWLDRHADDVDRFRAAWQLGVDRVLDATDDPTRDAIIEKTFDVTGSAADEMRGVLHDGHEGLIPDGRINPAALDSVLALRSRHGRPGAVADLTAALTAAGGSVLDTGIIDERCAPLPH
ncbi:MAG TPA: ABC transporter substrate-binding protein [Pseudonocardiaceae bacterium]|nr:ABC transporter substrate-binding protein [Pseudonocardiaceae bacterium]